MYTHLGGLGLFIFLNISALADINITSYQRTGDSALMTWTNDVSTGYYRVAWSPFVVPISWEHDWTNQQAFGDSQDQYLYMDLPRGYRVEWSSNAYDAVSNAVIGEDETYYSISENGANVQIENVEPGATYAIDWHNGTDWVRGWNDLCNLPATGLQMSAHVPLICRLAVLSTNVPDTIAGMAYIFGGAYAFGDGSKTVTVSGFYLSLTETTEAQWSAVRLWAVTNGYTDLPDLGDALPTYTNFPAAGLTWHDAVKWCNARSELESLAPCYTVTGAVYRAGTNTPICAWTNTGYRLPTECEWERAARGFITSAVFPWGGLTTNDIAANRANYRNSGDLSEGLSKLATPVGGWAYAPDEYIDLLNSMVPSEELFRLMSYLIYPYSGNDYGLLDMSGNVAEWCWDYYTHAGPNTASTNSTGPSTGSRRVVRGGHYLSNSTGVSLQRRALAPPNSRNDAIGFRTARKRTP